MGGKEGKRKERRERKREGKGSRSSIRQFTLPHPGQPRPESGGYPQGQAGITCYLLGCKKSSSLKAKKL